MEMKGTPASPATALARRVLPVPGGPSKITPLGILHPFLAYASGCFKKSTTSANSNFAPSHPATSSKDTPVSGTIWISALDLPIPMGLPGPPMPPIPPIPPPPASPPRRERKNRPAKRAAGRMRDWARSPRPPAASLAGSTVTSTLCEVNCVKRSGSLGRASSLRRAPSVSTPKSWVPSAEKVTFSILSPLTSWRKSEYRTSTGAPPLDWMTGISRSVEDTGAGGASSMAMERRDVRVICWGGAKAVTPLLARKEATTANVENFILMLLIVYTSFDCVEWID
mmetsp:Transcript_2772/g.5145  ORF Transcript_2772/g.5145 Transcript_2772/m.5145 type:complete len:282 (-) Transcript_2772:168-1013(-)